MLQNSIASIANCTVEINVLLYYYTCTSDFYKAPGYNKLDNTAV